MAFVEIIGQQPLIEVSSSEPAEVIVSGGTKVRMTVVVDTVTTEVTIAATQGPRGIQGIQGPAGPNTVTASTATDITGILKGNGTNVQQAVAGTDYQAPLVSGSNIKTIEGQSLLGSGNIDLGKSDVGLGNVDNTSDANKPISTATQTALNSKQDSLVSGTNIKTVNSNSLLGSGDVSVGTVTSVDTIGLLSGGPITGSGTITTSMATNKLVGRSTAGTGIMEEISIGAGLQLSGGSLVSTATGVPSGTASGTDTYTATIANVTGYNTNDGFIIKFTNANTGAATLNINSLGAKTIFKSVNVALSSGDIKAGQELVMVYDGTNFQAIGLAPTKAEIGLGNVDNTSDANKPISTATQTALNAKQDTLVSGTNIKTVNGNSLVGSGDISVGTVTSVAALTLGTSGADLSSSVANGTTTPTITLNVPTASATNRGVLNSTDWTTFNNKQNALSLGNLTETASSVLTITGGTGAVVGSGTTVEVKQASSSQSGFLSSTDWSTFNGKQNALTNPVTGTGTNNEIAAFNSTGSTITSLSTTTYPSLTELSYVKGVTSSIQTQLDAIEADTVGGRLYLFFNY